MLLAFDDDGPGPVVVLIHGLPFDRSMWSAQLSEVGSVYRVIAVDLRGRGESAVPDGDYPVDLLADDVIETIDGLELTEPIVLGGLSMGGYVALSLIARYPERFRALMLLSTQAKPDTAEAASRRLELASTVERQGKPDAVVDAMLPNLFSRAFAEQHPEVVFAQRERMLQSDPRGLVGTLRGLAVRPDRTGDLARIAVPTLVVAGSNDGIIPVERAESLAAGITGAKLVVIPRTGHVPPIEDPAGTNAAILGFLGSLSG